MNRSYSRGFRLSAGATRALTKSTLIIWLALFFFAGSLVAAILAWKLRATPDARMAERGWTGAFLALPTPIETPRDRRADRLQTGPRQVAILFSADGLTLMPQVMEMPRELPASTPTEVEFILQELLRGPSSSGLSRVVPEGTRLRGAFLREDTLVLDFSEDLVANPLGGATVELLCLQAIVQTALQGESGARAVRILVEGRPRLVLWEHMDISVPLHAVPSVVLAR